MNARKFKTLWKFFIMLSLFSFNPKILFFRGRNHHGSTVNIASVYDKSIENQKQTAIFQGICGFQ